MKENKNQIKRARPRCIKEYGFGGDRAGAYHIKGNKASECQISHVLSYAELKIFLKKKEM